MKKKLKLKFDSVDTLIVGMIISIYFTVLGLCLWAGQAMFEYSLKVFFDKDIPWYLDLLGSIVLNGALIVIWVFSLIWDACGGETPIFGG